MSTTTDIDILAPSCSYSRPSGRQSVSRAIYCRKRGSAILTLVMSTTTDIDILAPSCGNYRPGGRQSVSRANLLQEARFSDFNLGGVFLVQNF
ncbi:MAG: hypothetical protein F6J86_44415 [Symploca sp. SIO1B1]|nr:hypothetical protein [Symploca sp. SIO1B1]